MMKKVLFISSTGGHLFELLEFEEIFRKYDYYIVTEMTSMTLDLKRKYGSKIYYLLFCSRKTLYIYIFKYIYNCLYSFYLYLKLKPKYIVTTGAHTVVPICFIGKLFHAKIIFIETRANFKTRSLSGRIIYFIADLFIIQHEHLQRLYPRAVLCQYI
jgi:UDP-N-acetylglucosamine:LPS N-acetylglucosamine transferase